MLPTLFPQITPANEPFWKLASQGQLALPCCHRCGHLWSPPSPHCPQCLSADFSYRPLSGRATLWSWITMHRTYFPEFPAPYIVAFVQLEEGPMLMSTLQAGDPETLHCDMPLQVCFRPLSPDMAMHQFKPA